MSYRIYEPCKCDEYQTLAQLADEHPPSDDTTYRDDWCWQPACNVTRRMYKTDKVPKKRCVPKDCITVIGLS